MMLLVIFIRIYDIKGISIFYNFYHLFVIVKKYNKTNYHEIEIKIKILLILKIILIFDVLFLIINI